MPGCALGFLNVEQQQASLGCGFVRTNLNPVRPPRSIGTKVYTFITNILCSGSDLDDFAVYGDLEGLQIRAR